MKAEASHEPNACLIAGPGARPDFSCAKAFLCVDDKRTDGRACDALTGKPGTNSVTEADNVGFVVNQGRETGYFRAQQHNK